MSSPPPPANHPNQAYNVVNKQQMESSNLSNPSSRLFTPLSSESLPFLSLNFFTESRRLGTAMEDPFSEGFGRNNSVNSNYIGHLWIAQPYHLTNGTKTLNAMWDNILIIAEYK